MKKSAFTLVEVLVALAIFAMAAVVLGAGYVNILNSYEVVRRGDVDDPDVAYARQLLLTQSDLTTAEKGDTFDTADNRHVKWSADIEPTSTTDLFTVTFTCEITSLSLSAPKTVTQTFMLLRPSWSDATTRSNLRAAAAARIAQVQGNQTP